MFIKHIYFPQVDLSTPVLIQRVHLADRDGHPDKRLQNTRVHIGDSDTNQNGPDANPICFSLTTVPVSNESEYLCESVMSGRFVVIKKFGPTVSDMATDPNHFTWHINEVRVFAVNP